MKRFTIYFLLVNSLFLRFEALKANNPNELLLKMQQKYPDHKAIFLAHKREVQIDWVKDSLRVTAHQYYDILYLNDQANMYAEEKVYSSHFAKILDIDARTLIPTRKKYKEVEVTNFSRKSDISSGIFYDDAESVSFVFPAVQEGARSILNYQTLFTEPTFLNAFHFGSYLPVEKSELVIKVHRNIHIDYKYFNLDSLPVSEHILQEGDYKIYSFKTNNVAAIEREPDAPSFTYYSPHIVYFISQVKKQNSFKKYLGTPADLYNLYQQYIARINLGSEDSSMQPLVDSLIAGTHTDLEKVKRIYNWVQNNIKYVAFENGMRGLIPHDGTLVCKKRYGDCKDMASILHWMLKLANVPAHFTWIGTRDLPYLYTELSTPNVDNHMIATYYHQGYPVFLDATGKYATIEHPTSMIQGKEALVAIDPHNFKIEKVPVIPAFKNQLYDSVAYTLLESELLGEGMTYMTGYQKVYNTYLLEGLTDEQQIKAVNKLFQKGNNKFNIENYKIYNKNDKDKPLSFTYSFRLPGYITRIDDEIYINLNLDRSLSNQIIDIEKRKLPVDHEYLYEDTFINMLNLPTGSTTSFIPEPVEYKHKKFGFKIHYELTESYVKQYKNIYINTIMLSPADFKSWNEMIAQLNDAYREAIILKTGSNKL